MRQIRNIILPFMLMGCITYSAQGVDERAKKRASDKANGRVDTRIDQGLDKSMDAIEGLFKKKKKSEESGEETESYETETGSSEQEHASQENSPGSSLFGSMFEPAEWEDSYDFDFNSIAQITTTDKKGKEEKAEWEWMISDEAFAMVMKDPKGKDPDARIIFDLSNHSFITLTEDKGEKQGMAIAMNKEQMAAAVEEGVEEGTTSYGNFQKTGKTKQILGYRCEEYAFSDDDTEGSMWMTTELNADMNRVFGMMTQSGNKNKSGLPENYPQGFALEMESSDTKKHTSHHYLVIAVDTDANINIDLSPYNVQDPIGMMNSGK